MPDHLIQLLEATLNGYVMCALFHVGAWATGYIARWVQPPKLGKK